MSNQFYFNNKKLTEKTLLKTDKYFADICQGCIDEVINGDVTVNDKESYFEYNLKRKKEYLKGINRNTLGYLQQAYYIQEGEMIALLP